jgi:hypothetical protein
VSVGSGPTYEIIEKSRMARRVGTAVAAGIAGAALGIVLGLVVGANIGGNWFTSVSLAGQRGYEATGLVGAVVGGVVFGAACVWLVLRRGWGPRSGLGSSAGGRSTAAKTQRVILWLVLSIIAGFCLMIGAFWLYAIVTGGKYM